MADSMIERIAIILNTTPDEFGSEYVAGLILEAMREPTPKMIEAMDEHAGTIAPQYAYEAAIDAALKE